MKDTLALQREILAAVDDPEKMAALAEAYGIDPALWRYWEGIQSEVRRLEEEVRKLSQRNDLAQIYNARFFRYEAALKIARDALESEGKQ